MVQVDQDKFLRMMSHASQGRMEEQRCVLNPSQSANSTPRHSGTRAPKSTVPTGGPLWCSGVGLGCIVINTSNQLSQSIEKLGQCAFGKRIPKDLCYLIMAFIDRMLLCCPLVDCMFAENMFMLKLNQWF